MAVFAGIANINEVVELTNIGTLFAFVLVCIGVTVLRYKDPDRPRGFRVPLRRLAGARCWAPAPASS